MLYERVYYHHPYNKYQPPPLIFRPLMQHCSQTVKFNCLLVIRFIDWSWRKHCDKWTFHVRSTAEDTAQIMHYAHHWFIHSLYEIITKIGRFAKLVVILTTIVTMLIKTTVPKINRVAKHSATRQAVNLIPFFLTWR